MANIQSRIAVLLAHRSVERHEDYSSPQTSEEHGRPVRMVADLDRDNSTFSEAVQLIQEIVCLLLDLLKRTEHLSLLIEDGGSVSVAIKGRFPGVEQRIGEFHHLRNR